MAEQSLEERKLSLEERRLALDEQKWAADRASKPGFDWKNPLLIAILTAAAAAAGNAVVSRLNSDGQLKVERLKGEQALITEMIKTDGNGPKTADNLRFLVETGLIEDKARRERLKTYLERNKDRPDLLPSLSSSGLPVSTAERAKGLTAGDACKARISSGELCVEKGILLQASGKPFAVVDGTRRTDALASPPIAIVLHWSAGPDGASKTIFKDPSFPGSSHIEINRDGSVTQLVPFDIAANHVGAGEWKGERSLNTKTIGITFANWGRLSRTGNVWTAFTGRTVPDRDVVVTADGTGWERYTDAQLRTGEQVVKALHAAYPSVRAVLGHSVLASGRKEDPGPVLPIERYEALVAAR